MTFLELQSDLSRLLSDSTYDLFSLVDRKRFLNLGYQYVNREVLPLTKYETLVVPAAAGTIELPADFLAMGEAGIKFRLNADEELTELRPHQNKDLDRKYPGWQVAGYALGSPEAYKVEALAGQGLFATLVPAPRTTGELVIEYFPSFSDLTADADTPFGNQFAQHHYAIACAAEVFARQMEADADAEGRARFRRDEEIRRFRKAVLHVREPNDDVIRGPTYRRRFTY